MSQVQDSRFIASVLTTALLTLATLTPVNAASPSPDDNIGSALELAGRVTGTVTIDGGPSTLPWVDILALDGSVVMSAQPDDTGSYVIENLPAGDYLAAASGVGLTAVLFDDISCPGSRLDCPLAEGTTLEVVVETTLSGIDFDLDHLGAISGTLTTLESGATISNARIAVWDAAGIQQYFADSDADGNYLIGDVQPGSYFVTAIQRGHFGQLYDGLPCNDPRTDCDPTTGTAVIVTLNTTTANIDFAMPRRPMGSITGTVLSEALANGAAGEPIPFIPITAWDFDGNSMGIGYPSDDGRYEISGLDPGTYVVTARTPGQFIDELYFDQPCPNLSCDLTTGTPVTVLDETTTPNIDFALTRLGVISGRIRDAVTHSPIGASARAWNAAGEFVDLAVTDINGNYSIEGLQPGTYFVDTTNSSSYINELYDDLPCPPETCNPTTGTPIDVALNAPVTSIDFDLDLAQGISGRVSREDTGELLDRILIYVWDPSGSFVQQTFTNHNGDYRIGLPTGTYFVTTDSSNNFTFDGVDERYDNQPCARQLCDPTLGTPVVVHDNTVTEGIHFALALTDATCVPSSFNLCLADNRFNVQVVWTDFEGQRGLAQVRKITDATGTIWFFGPDNIEIIVKVLDACVDPFNSFWVFAAGLTNVGVELLIIDTVTGEGRTYITNAGEAFGPILDTSAFADCPPASANETEGDQLARETRREIEAQLEQLRAGQALPPSDASLATVAPKQGTCLPTTTSLCLEQGRFRVESTWRTPAGETGDGQAVPLTDATGTFWFFSLENVEALVKVLNACDLSGFENFWVFAAGLTDVEVMIRVTDTVSGEVKEYLNPQGTPFRPVQDTRAFETCEDISD